MNAQLDKGGKPTINNLKTDLCDGVRLLYLLVNPPLADAGLSVRGMVVDVGNYE
jgi:hypothetical protein